MTRSSRSLADLQSWMQLRVMHAAQPRPDVTPGELDWSIADLVTQSSRLSPAQRLAVYQQAYLARLVDCLRVEFPAVRQASGDEAFDGFAAGYLEARPSQSYTLADLGRGFSEYLAATRPCKEPHSEEPDFADFLIDLACLERVYSEVFDRPGPERQPGLTSEQMTRITPEQFAGSRLVLHETVRLVSLRFPCHEYATAVRQGREAVPPLPGHTRLCVFRRDYTVRRMILTPVQFELLSALHRGETVDEAIRQVFVAAEAPDRQPADVQRLFAEWTTAEFIREIVLDA